MKTTPEKREHCSISNHQRRLTPEQVQEIRDYCAAGCNQRELAEMYGVDQSTISNIKHGRSWRWLPVAPPKTDE